MSGDIPVTKTTSVQFGFLECIIISGIAMMLFTLGFVIYRNTIVGRLQNTWTQNHLTTTAEGKLMLKCVSYSRRGFIRDKPEVGEKNAQTGSFKTSILKMAQLKQTLFR